MKQTMVVAVALLVAVLVGGCAGATREEATAAPPPLALHALDGRVVRLGHVTDEHGANARVVSGGAPVGGVEPLPAVVSARHQEALAEALQRYRRGDVAGARALLEPAYRDEPDNLFLLDAYARTLYRGGDRAGAFPLYHRLVEQLDGRWKDPDGAVTVDLWFVDAYWKLGTLYMDRGEYRRAAFEISRALAGGIAWEPLAVDQALSYLTKAFYELGDRPTARYYADRALLHNPHNTFVRGYLDRMR